MKKKCQAILCLKTNTSLITKFIRICFELDVLKTERKFNKLCMSKQSIPKKQKYSPIKAKSTAILFTFSCKCLKRNHMIGI